MILEKRKVNERLQGWEEIRERAEKKRRGKRSTVAYHNVSRRVAQGLLENRALYTITHGTWTTLNHPSNYRFRE